jgi:Phage integrase family/Luciferase-like monooxygenase
VKRAIYVSPFGELADPRVLAELAIAAEERGWDGFFVWDHIVYRAPVRAVADPWVALAAVACATRKLRIGPLVTPLSRRRVRTVMIPDIAMPAVRRLADRGAPGRERSDGRLYSRLINGERGGYLGYAMWRRYLKLAQGYTAAHPDGIVSYTAHELRHVCASLLIASGASDVQVAHQMGHSKIETTKNIYGHLFAQDRALILDAMNQAVSRLHAYENRDPGEGEGADAAA